MLRIIILPLLVAAVLIFLAVFWYWFFTFWYWSVSFVLSFTTYESTMLLAYAIKSEL